MIRIFDILFDIVTLNVDAGSGRRQVPSPPTERVVAVMHLLAAHPERNFSLADICRSLGISRATGHAILATLAHHRWVVRHESSASYSWGPAIGALARPTNDREFRPLLENLSETVGAQVFLARRENASLVVTDSVGIRSPLRASRRVCACRWWRRSGAIMWRGRGAGHQGVARWDR